MKKRFGVGRFGILSGLVVFALSAALTLGVAFNTPAQPASAFSAWQSFILASGTGVTQTVTGSAQATALYDVADCYSTFSAGTQTITTTLQHGDGSSWVDLYSYAAQSTAGTSFTQTALYGRQVRAVVALSTTNEVTFTVRCIAKIN